MWASIIKQLVEFEWIIFVTILAGIIIAVAGTLLTKNLQWKQKRWRLLGVFCALNNRELLWLAFAILRYLFIVTAMTFGFKLGLAQISYYTVLCLGCLILLPYIKRLVVDLLNSIVVFGALFASGILAGYIDQIKADIYIMTISVLLSIFVIIYATYFLFKDITDMLKGKQKKSRLEEMT